MNNSTWKRHGVARRHVLARELGESTLRKALGGGALLQPWRGVLVEGTRMTDPVTRAAAGLLAAGQGAVVSLDTAAFLSGCTAADTTDVHVTVPYARWVRSRSGLVVHHDRFCETDVEFRHGLPMLSLPAALTELLCVRTRWVALACLDQALAARPPDDVGEFVGELAYRLATRDDRRGVRVAETLLRLGDARAESPQESRLRLLVVESGFPAPVPQYVIETLDGTLLYVLDLAWPELRIGLEYDGYEAHEGREAYDAERDRRTAERGWITVRARKEDLAAPDALITELARAFGRRGMAVQVRERPTHRRGRQTRRRGWQTRG